MLRDKRRVKKGMRNINKRMNKVIQGAQSAIYDGNGTPNCTKLIVNNQILKSMKKKKVS